MKLIPRTAKERVIAITAALLALCLGGSSGATFYLSQRMGMQDAEALAIAEDLGYPPPTHIQSSGCSMICISTVLVYDGHAGDCRIVLTLDSNPKRFVLYGAGKPGKVRPLPRFEQPSRPTFDEALAHVKVYKAYYRCQP